MTLYQLFYSSLATGVVGGVGLVLFHMGKLIKGDPKFLFNEFPSILFHLKGLCYFYEWKAASHIP